MNLAHSSQPTVVFADGETWVLDKSYLMGVINATPDSFFPQSRADNEKDFLKKVEQMEREGVDIVDVGGASSRPGAQNVSVEEERSRVMSKIASCKKHFPNVRLSLDTTNEIIAREAADLGVDMINDISAGRFSDDKIFEVAKNYDLPLVLMHMRGNPQTMQDNPVYPDGVLTEVLRFFDERLQKLAQMGVDKKKIILDFGFGFGKKVKDNLELCHEIPAFSAKGCAVLVGASMKGTLGKICDIQDVSERAFATVGVHLCTLFSGANIIRVHHVAKTKQAITAFFAALPPKKRPFHLRHELTIKEIF